MTAAGATALLVVDVQHDFCEGGSLAVEDGADVARRIGDLLASGRYAISVATKDHHVDPGSHFSDQPDFVDSWPPHCVVGTTGADLHPPLRDEQFDAVVTKGEYSAAYSGFEGVTAKGTSLADWLRAHGVDQVDVCGIATDFCVRATALDAARAGFAVRVITGLTAAVSQDNVRGTLADFDAAGVRHSPSTV